MRVRSRRRRIALRTDEDDADLALVGAQMQNRVFQFARDGERPKPVTQRVRRLD
jgi:hypothetical protein